MVIGKYAMVQNWGILLPGRERLVLPRLFPGVLINLYGQFRVLKVLLAMDHSMVHFKATNHFNSIN